MTNKHAPGPWFTEPVFDGRDRPATIYAVARRMAIADGRYEFESMLNERGNEAIFQTKADAEAAIAKATREAK